MSLLLIDDFKRYSDRLRTPHGDVLDVRFVEPRDTEELQHYVRSLSTRSRYNRFFGAISELPTGLLHDFLQVGAHQRFTIVATMKFDGFDTIVAEARYALHEPSATLEFGLSVDDRWQGHGIATALLKNLECRAAALGAESMFGDTLRSNEAMIALARKSGFALVNHPDDWKLVRFQKDIAAAPADIPCASWRLAAVSRQPASPSASA
jgi:GNAT superfamily N-acetyltransferase